VKFNRSKIMIAVVMVLAITVFLSGCTAAPNSPAPGFLEVGEQYIMYLVRGGRLWEEPFKVLEIREDGWILVRSICMIRPSAPEGVKTWINSAQITLIREIRKGEI